LILYTHTYILESANSLLHSCLYVIQTSILHILIYIFREFNFVILPDD
jgi:hypothetical protein